MQSLPPPAPPRAAKADLEAAVALLKDAKRPVVLMGKTDWTDAGWNARIKLVERLGAVVFTDLKNRSSFPTDHPCHVAAPFNQVGRAPKRIVEILEQADVILALEWTDLASALRIKKGGKIGAKVIASAMDQYLHNGAHANYQALPESDIFMAASADSVIADLNAELGAGKKDCWQQAQRKEVKVDPTRVTMDQLAVSLRAAFDDPDKVSLAAICRGWTADLWPFRHPRAYLGKDGGGVATKKVTYAPDLILKEALQFIEANRSKPFFLYFSPILPHANNEANRMKGNGYEVPDLGIYKDEPWTEQNKAQAAMITYLDMQVGQLLDSLEKLGLEKNTVVFFTSANGPHREGGNQPEFFEASGPFQGIKRSLHDGGIRVPMIVRWPGKIAAGKTTNQMGYHGDFLSTACEIAGVKRSEEHTSELQSH